MNKKPSRNRPTTQAGKPGRKAVAARDPEPGAKNRPGFDLGGAVGDAKPTTSIQLSHGAAQRANAMTVLSRSWAEAAVSFEVTRTDEEWRRILMPAQYDVLRKHETERAGSSPLDREKRAGTFLCAGCDLDAYRSAHKFDSGTGWPSFTRPIEGAVATSEDRAGS